VKDRTYYNQIPAIKTWPLPSLAATAKAIGAELQDLIPLAANINPCATRHSFEEVLTIIYLLFIIIDYQLLLLLIIYLNLLYQTPVKTRQLQKRSKNGDCERS